MNTSGDYRTTTNGMYGFDSLVGLNTEPKEFTNVESLDSTFY